jgi:hypothetical protein
MGQHTEHLKLSTERGPQIRGENHWLLIKAADEFSSRKKVAL